MVWRYSRIRTISDYQRTNLIYYLVILYSILNPLKEFSRAGYNIPKGLASMDRIDKILQAEVKINDPEKPVHIDSSNMRLSSDMSALLIQMVRTMRASQNSIGY